MDSKTILPLFFLALTFQCAAAETQDLPRVLIIGDSVYRQPLNDLKKAFEGKAELVLASVNDNEVRNSTELAKQLEQLLGQSEWDVIHFNVGLGDLIYRAPRMKSFRVLPKKAGGVRATEPDTYQANLIQIVERLEKTNAVLIWASTTPIRHSRTGVFDVGSELQYNAIAEKIMKSKGIELNDMHEYVRNKIDMKKPAPHGMDPFHFDKKPISDPIIKAIEKGLIQKKKPSKSTAASRFAHDLNRHFIYNLAIPSSLRFEINNF